jgi:NADH-quinone oxidoreductase subunit M
MLGFFIAFAVKLPMFPFHTWLPDAHTEAPTAGSIILAGLLLKTGGYGLLRFVLPLFPEASRDFAPAAMTLAVIGILYGAVMALAQNDFKRLIAYSSVSHLGFVLLGVFAWNEWALQGALMQMICHGLSTGALFFIAGALQQRMHTRDLGRMGGLWRTMPVMSGAALFFIMASLGLPGLGNFVAEFLVLVGAFRIDVVLASLATVGILVGTVYGLKLMQQAFYGPNLLNHSLPDLSMREGLLIAILAVSLVWLGLYPQPVFDALNPAVQSLQQQASRSLAIL